MRTIVTMLAAAALLLATVPAAQADTAPIEGPVAVGGTVTLTVPDLTYTPWPGYCYRHTGTLTLAPEDADAYAEVDAAFTIRPQGGELRDAWDFSRLTPVGANAYEFDLVLCDPASRHADEIYPPGAYVVAAQVIFVDEGDVIVSEAAVSEEFRVVQGTPPAPPPVVAPPAQETGPSVKCIRAKVLRKLAKKADDRAMLRKATKKVRRLC